MTREEAKSCIGTIEMLRILAYNIHGVMDVIDANNCKKIIKALEQEPTTKNDLGVDAVSRKAVINQIFYSTDNNGDVVLGSALRERIARLPSVTPIRPKGHWIANAPQYDILNPQYFCSECGNAHTRTPYCEMCGAKMIEP